MKRPSKQLVTGQVRVNMTLTVFSLTGPVPYSGEVQQPMRATAILSRYQQTHEAAPLDREQGRIGSLHPEASQASGHPRARSKKHGQIRRDTAGEGRATDQCV